jgi:hypothetical protein
MGQQVAERNIRLPKPSKFRNELGNRVVQMHQAALVQQMHNHRSDGL